MQHWIKCLSVNIEEKDNTFNEIVLKFTFSKLYCLKHLVLLVKILLLYEKWTYYKSIFLVCM